jgi:demethylmenaquinone methyltransferase/2-methoxy-6-polyprenyl-1,4-benzoquinol methylase
LHERLASGAVVLIADNRYVEGNSTPLSRRDDAGNTFQSRVLENGERYEVLKNFPVIDELRAWGERCGDQVEVRMLKYFWILSYRAR